MTTIKVNSSMLSTLEQSDRKGRLCPSKENNIPPKHPVCIPALCTPSPTFSTLPAGHAPSTGVHVCFRAHRSGDDGNARPFAFVYPEKGGMCLPTYYNIAVSPNSYERRKCLVT